MTAQSILNIAFASALPLGLYGRTPFPSADRTTGLSSRTPSTTCACTETTNTPRTLIIGGGAAGFFCAVTFSRLCSTPVTILESTSEVLQKVRISGGGRCNVTSGLFHDDTLSFSAQYARGAREMPAVLSRFGARDVVQFFENEGVALKAEDSGKVFPKSDSSESIITALVEAARRGGVHVRTKARVTDVKPMAEGFRVSLRDGGRLDAQYVVIATGSARNSYVWAEQMGHRIVPPVPSLFSFRIDDDELRRLAGVSASDVSMELIVHGKKKKRVSGLQQRGSLLVTHWGLSGPAVLSLSAFGARILAEQDYQMKCVINWVPQLSLNAKLKMLNESKRIFGNKNVSTFSPFRKFVPNRLWRYIVERTGIGAQKWASVRKDQLDALANHVHALSYRIAGKGEFKDEFVTAGGVALTNIDTKTFESRWKSGLYFAGEVLDVDGRTGGYNLEFAWSSGYIAAVSIAEKVLEVTASADRRDCM